MSLIYFILIAFGMTQLLVYGTIFNKIRPSYPFFHCSMCMGWWVGLFLWAINQYTELITFDCSIITGLMLACLSSGTSYMLGMIVGDKGINLNTRGDYNG